MALKNTYPFLEKDVMIKITYMGNITEKEIEQVMEMKGEKSTSDDQEIWDVSPVVCFQNEIAKELAIKHLRSAQTSYKILVTSVPSKESSNDKDQNIITVDLHHIREAITSGLEKPLLCLFNEWIGQLESLATKEKTDCLIKEIKSIKNQMSFETHKANSQSSSSETGFKSILPTDIKKYLRSLPNVYSFGIWQNSQLKVFVENTTDVEKLQNTLEEMSEGFFKNNVKIEKRQPVEKVSLKQGECIMRNNEDEGKVLSATLGGFVTPTDGSGKIYALTCNHIFPVENMLAYAEDSSRSVEIGKCMFSTREKHCDFAVIEINESVTCNVTFMDEDGEETIAHLYNESMEKVHIVHKIGAESNVTTGRIECSEYYVNNLIDEDNEEFIFLVKGIDGIFSKQGDSGSLVFSHPTGVDQTYVNVIGMVYGNLNNLTGDNDTASHSDVSTCFRMPPALQLLRDKKGLFVKFKDNLGTS